MTIALTVLFVTSAILLLAVLFRAGLTVRRVSMTVLHLVAAAVVLFIVNGSGLFGEFYMPINAFTVATVGILGVFGLALIVGIKLTLM